MRRTRRIGSLALILGVAACAQGQQAAPPAGPAQAGPAGPAPVEATGAAGTRTIWDGVYTVEQADRGEQTAVGKCFWCHSAQEWSQAMFITSWAGRPIRDLYAHLRDTMPYDAPGSLTRAEYADIISYMLRLNEIPPGDVELPSDSQLLGEIAVTRAEGP